jgi:diaminopimelate epimerase
LPDQSGWDVEIELPRLPARKVSASTMLDFSGVRAPCTVVELEGISHILISDSQMPFTNDPDKFNSMVADVIAQLSWGDRAAFGLIWVKQVDDQFAIEPVVFVKSIQTCIYESACGSGSIAVALAATPEGAQRVTAVRQPSGAILHAGIDQTNTLQGIAATLRGPVEIRGDLNQMPRLLAANE